MRSIKMRPIKKLLVANRSEIATRVFRSAYELGIRTVAIFTHEDRYALHRFKADEAYLIGKPGEPIRAYLDIGQIIHLAKKQGVDAIHPGYGFLSEKAEFAQACEDQGIQFVGPPVRVLQQLGDKTAAHKLAQQAAVPVLGGSDDPIRDPQEGLAIATKLGFPVILKAAHGGGGRGMRVVHKPDELVAALEQAQRESLSAFGSSDIFLEKFVARRGTSKSSCWAISTATWCTSASETVRCSAAIRRSSKSRRRRISIRAFETRFARQRWPSATRRITRTRARLSSWLTTTRASSTSLRSIREFKSNTR